MARMFTDEVHDEAERRVLAGEGMPGCPECEAAAERLGVTREPETAGDARPQGSE